MTHTASVRRSILAVAVVGAALVVLHRFGDGPLAAPPLGSSAELDRWWSTRDPVTVGFACFRLGALVVAYHLLVTSLVAVVGAVTRRPGVVRAADRWTLPPFRGVLARVVGLGLSTATALTPPVTGAGATPSASVVVDGTATLRHAADEVRVLRPTPTGTATLRVADPRPTTGEATLREAPTTTGDPDAAPAESPAAADPPGPAAPPVGSAAPTAPGAPTVQRHRVQAGDHLWALAESAVATALGRPPTDAEVAPHWRRVVDANPQLADPDLLFAGDEVWLPAP